MKYILLPILKFIWALFLSILMLFPYITWLTIALLLLIIVFIWQFNIPEWYKKWLADLFVFEFRDNYTLNISPYFEPVYAFHKFKTYYHYIWNIK